MVNKTDAANYLGCGIDNLQRILKKGEIAFTYIKGKYGKEVDITQEELDRYKTERENNSTPVSVPAIVKNGNSTLLSSSGSGGIQGSNMVVSANDFMSILNRLADVLTKQNQQLAFPVNERLTLTLDEASTWSNLPVKFIRLAIKENKLAAFKTGRSWRVRREDLEGWVKGL